MLQSVIILAAPTSAHLIVVTAALLAGLVRGFSGFGNAVIYVPIAAAAISPVFAALSMQIMDTAPTIPLLRRAFRQTTWRQIGPLILSAGTAVPIGVYGLKTIDPVVLRWVVCVIILAFVAVLWSGWRMKRAPNLRETIGIGGLSGLMSGSSGMGGPPVILFYLSGQSNAASVRAHLMVFLATLTMINGIVYFLNDLFTGHLVFWGVLMMLPYGVGLFVGARLFGRASEAMFRKVAFLVILTSATASLPLFDSLFR